MSLFAGILRIEDLNTALSTFEPEVISDAISDVLQKFQQERDQTYSLLVDSTTTAHSAIVREAGFDEGQELGPDGRPLETHVGGKYEVGFPVKRIGWALGWNRETFAHMSVADLDREVAAKTAGNARRHSREMRKALMLKSNYTFTDEIHGGITVRRLANTDGTLFGAPPAEDNHYLTSGYAAASISPINNPFATLAAEVREHFTSDTRIVAFVNSSHVPIIQSGLTTFVDTGVEGIVPANNTAVANELNLSVPGYFLGIDSASGVYVYVWDAIPSNYILAGAVDEAAPLRRRVPVPVSLQGFQLLEEESHLPFYKRTWMELFGYGVSNRLSWACMFLDAGSTYTDPTL